MKINDDSRGMYNTDSQIRFKTSLLNWSLCDYSDACILVKGTLTFVGVETTEALATADSENKQIIFKDCEPFADCVSKINNKNR